MPPGTLPTSTIRTEGRQVGEAALGAGAVDDDDIGGRQQVSAADGEQGIGSRTSADERHPARAVASPTALQRHGTRRQVLRHGIPGAHGQPGITRRGSRP